MEKRLKGQPSRVYFAQSGSQISQMSHQLSLDINREECQRYTAYVKVSLGCMCGPAAGCVWIGQSTCSLCPRLISASAGKLFVSPCWVRLKVTVSHLMVPETMRLKCVSTETDRNRKQSLLCHRIVPLLCSHVI